MLSGSFSFSQLIPVKFEIISNVDTIEPESTFKLAVRATIEKDWHIYWKGSGENGLPTLIDWVVPDNFIAQQTSYPVPNKTEAFNLISHTYKNEVIFISEITSPKSLDKKNYNFKAIIDWQACKETCLPPTITELEVNLSVGDKINSSSY